MTVTRNIQRVKKIVSRVRKSRLYRQNLRKRPLPFKQLKGATGADPRINKKPFKGMVLKQKVRSKSLSAIMRNIRRLLK